MITAKRLCLIASVVPSFLWMSACSNDHTPFRSVSLPDIPHDTAPVKDSSKQYLKSFRAGTIENAHITVDSGFKLLQQSISLAQAPASTTIYQQPERPFHEDSFTQGNSGKAANQSFAASEAGIFDLLILIDNSASMGPYQHRLGETLPNILRHVSNTNWQIAVVTTSNPCLNKSADGRKVLTKHDYDRDPIATDQAFKELINVGDSGDSIERGILRATQALTGQGCTAESNTWLRPDSQRAVLLVTDENNCGSAPNEGCLGEPHAIAQYFFDRAKFPVTVNGLLLLNDPPAADPNNPADPLHDCENSGGYDSAPNPREYLSMISRSQGIYSDICTSNYKDVLEQISLNVKKKINAQFELDHSAVPSSLEVLIDNRATNAFTVNGRTLSMQNPLSESAQITVRYKYDPAPILSEFKTLKSYDSRTLEVLVNQKRMTQRDITLGDGAVTFKALPPEKAEIKIRYRENSALPSSFTYDSTAIDDSLKVLVDEHETKRFTINKDTHKVELSDPAFDGQTVKISYEKPGDKTLDYAIVGPDLDQIESLEVVDATSGEALPAFINEGRLHFPPETVRDARNVVARYNMQNEFVGKVFRLKLDQAPLPGTLSIEANGDREICGEQRDLKPEELSFQCKDEDFEAIDVTYNYVADYRNTFDLDLDVSGSKSIRVYVNNNEISDYHLIGSQLVILKEQLPAGADIRVMVVPE